MHAWERNLSLFLVKLYEYLDFVSWAFVIVKFGNDINPSCRPTIAKFGNDINPSCRPTYS